MVLKRISFRQPASQMGVQLFGGWFFEYYVSFFLYVLIRIIIICQSTEQELQLGSGVPRKHHQKSEKAFFVWNVFFLRRQFFWAVQETPIFFVAGWSRYAFGSFVWYSARFSDMLNSGLLSEWKEISFTLCPVDFEATVWEYCFATCRNESKLIYQLAGLIHQTVKAGGLCQHRMHCQCANHFPDTTASLQAGHQHNLLQRHCLNLRCVQKTN